VAQLKQNTPVDQVLELLTEQGSEGLAEAIRILLNAAMLFERERFLGAAPYERTPDNASQYVVRVEQGKEVASDLRAIFNAPNRSEADRLLSQAVKK